MGVGTQVEEPAPPAVRRHTRPPVMMVACHLSPFYMHTSFWQYIRA